MPHTLEDCLFCKIVAGTIPADVVYRDDHVVAFRDINPQAPTHVLLIPTTHYENLAELAAEDPQGLAALLVAVRTVADAEGVARSGYRIVSNTGVEAGQAVFHAHVHLVGGRPMGWPPG